MDRSELAKAADRRRRPPLEGLVAQGESVWLNTPAQVAELAQRAKATGKMTPALDSLLRAHRDALSRGDQSLGIKYRLVPEGLETLDPSDPGTTRFGSTDHEREIPRIRYNFGHDTPSTRAHERFHATDPRSLRDTSREELEAGAEGAQAEAEEAHRRLQTERETLDPVRDPKLTEMFADASTRANNLRQLNRNSPPDLRARYASALAQRAAILER